MTDFSLIFVYRKKKATLNIVLKRLCSDAPVLHWSHRSRLHSALQMTFTVEHQHNITNVINHAEMFDDNTETKEEERWHAATAAPQNMAFFFF